MLRIYDLKGYGIDAYFLQNKTISAILKTFIFKLEPMESTLTTNLPSSHTILCQTLMH